MAEKKFRNFQDLAPPPYLYFANLSDLPIISQWGTSEFSFTSLKLCGLILEPQSSLMSILLDTVFHFIGRFSAYPPLFICMCNIIPRPAGGGGAKGPPCGFSQIAPEVLGISL